MIVISGALVLVALVLLVVGLTMTDLQFVYASIAVSLLAFVFLVIGILQRRGEQPAAAAEPAGEPAAVPAGAGAAERPQGGSVPVAAVPVDVSKRPEPAADVDPPVEDDDVEDEMLEGGLVLVVAGRPRYHIDGCRYLNGKDVEEIDVFDARDEGFTPCGVCKPDEALAAELEAGDVELVEEEVEVEEPLDDEDAADEDPADEPAAAQADEDDELDDDELDDELDDEEQDDSDAAPAPAGGSTRLDPAATQTLAVPAAPVKKAAAKKAPAKAARKAPAKAKAKATGKAAAEQAPAEQAPAALPLSAPAARSTAARSVPAAAKAGPRTAAKAAPAAPAAPAKAAAAASTPAARTAAKKGTVVVIPDRGRFHVADCRYVRDAPDALELSKASATKQGYAACGVCKP